MLSWTQQARQSLEKLLSNVKGDSIELENRLQVSHLQYFLFIYLFFLKNFFFQAWQAMEINYQSSKVMEN